MTAEVRGSKAEKVLAGRIAVVTGASRGVGRGVAVGLGEAGATVYVTGRSTQPGSSPWPGTIVDAAEEVTRAGGLGIPAPCDHSRDEQVELLFKRVQEKHGRLDILVNNVFAAPEKMPIGVPFWELPLSLWDLLHNVGLRSHFVAAKFAAPLLLASRNGLIVNTSSGGAVRDNFNVPFGVQKAGVDRMTKGMAHDLRPHGVAVVSIWPGFIKSEKFLAQPDRYPPELAKRIRENGETAIFAGRGVAALASDPRVMLKSGQVLLVGELARDYHFTDIDGTVPLPPARN